MEKIFDVFDDITELWGKQPQDSYSWTILLGKQYLLLWGLCLCYLTLKTFLSGTESESRWSKN